MMQWRLNESTRAYVEETMREHRTEIATLEMAMDGMKALYEQRIAALEAAARLALGHWVNDDGVCWTCRSVGAHENDCWVGALAALLEET